MSLIIFGNWVEQRRHVAGLTQAQAAKAAKITRVRWSQIATGKGGRPRAATAVRMAKAINGDLFPSHLPPSPLAGHFTPRYAEMF